MDGLSDNRSLTQRHGDSRMRCTHRWRNFADRDDMEANGGFVAGEDRVEQNGGNLYPEILVVEFHFAVAVEDAVGAERRVDRHGHRVRFAVEDKEAGHDRGAFTRAGHDDADDAAAPEAD